MYSPQERRLMQDLARRSIHYGTEHGRLLQISAKDYPGSLQAYRATFVTLHKHNELRGCIGTLEPYQSLICDVAEHAYQAAFGDPRFPPVVAIEVDQLDIHISVLSPPESMHFHSEDDLIGQLRQGVDGLILEDGAYRGTFLPSVWESLPEPSEFWCQLKRKANLPLSHWSNTLRVRRYTAENIV